jgi:hypothetical protein
MTCLRPQNRIQTLTAAAFLAGIALTPFAPVGAETLRSDVSAQTIGVRLDDRELLRYQHAPNPFKPYVQALSTPQGRQILRDAPHDHLHHHALMFAIGAGGVNFWEEGPQAGKQIPVGEPEVTVESEGRPSAKIIQQLQWQDADGKVVLLESRQLTLHPEAVAGASLLTWDSRWEVPEGQSRVELWGRHYFGLGLRMVPSMDVHGEFRNSEGDAGEEVRGSERRVGGDWCAYTAPVDGQPVTVAMLDHPENRREATWFTMTTPFAYLSATLNLDREPMALSRDEPLRVRYGIVLWDSNPEGAEIAAAYETWQRLAAGE